MPKKTENIALHFAAQTVEAEAELEKAGYRLPSRPLLERPAVPAHPTELTDDELMDMWSLLTRWQDHVSGVLGMCEVDERCRSSIYDMAHAEILSTNAPKTRNEGSVTVAKAETALHPQVQEARNKLDLAYARRKVMQMMSENIDRDLFILSRELTRREGRYNNEMRGGRYRP